MEVPAHYAVVDLETTGLSPRRDHILQVAVVRLDAAGGVIDEWSTYVRPRWWPFTRTGPTRIHDITRRTLRRGRPLAEVMAGVAERTADTVLVAHNAPFDTEFLRRAARRTGTHLGWSDELCTLRLSRRLDPDRRLTHGLLDVCARYGVSLDRPHDALADAAATAAVLPRLLAAHGVDVPARPGQLDALGAR